MFRVGVNLGDVVIDGDDIQGNGVNVAASVDRVPPESRLSTLDWKWLSENLYVRHR